MTMQKARLKAMRDNPYVMFKTKRSGHCKPKQRDRITAAINSKNSLKDLPSHVREMIIERACLRAEIVAITERERGNTKSTSSVLIAQKLKRIDVISDKLESRKLHA